MKYTSTNGCLFYYDRVLYSWKVCEPTMLFLLGFEAITMYDKSQSDNLTLTKYIYQTFNDTTIKFYDFKIWDDIYNFLAKSGYIEDNDYYIKYNCYGLKLLLNELTGTSKDRTVPIIFKNDSNSILIDLNGPMRHIKDRNNNSKYDLQAQKICDIFNDAAYDKDSPDYIDIYKDGNIYTFVYHTYDAGHEVVPHSILITGDEYVTFQKYNTEQINLHTERLTNSTIHKYLDYKAMYSYALGVLYGCRCLGYSNSSIWRLDPDIWYTGELTNLVRTAWETFRFHYANPIYMHDASLKEKYQALQLNKLWNLQIDESPECTPTQYEQLLYRAFKANSHIKVNTEPLIYYLPTDDDLLNNVSTLGTYSSLFSNIKQPVEGTKVIFNSEHPELNCGLIDLNNDPIIRYLGDYPIKIYPAYSFEHKVLTSDHSAFAHNEKDELAFETTYLCPGNNKYFIPTGNLGWVNFDETSWQAIYEVKDNIEVAFYPDSQTIDFRIPAEANALFEYDTYLTSEILDGYNTVIDTDIYTNALVLKLNDVIYYIDTFYDKLSSFVEANATSDHVKFVAGHLLDCDSYIKCLKKYASDNAHVGYSIILAVSDSSKLFNDICDELNHVLFSLSQLSVCTVTTVDTLAKEHIYLADNYKQKLKAYNYINDQLYFFGYSFMHPNDSDKACLMFNRAMSSTGAKISDDVIKVTGFYEQSLSFKDLQVTAAYYDTKEKELQSVNTLSKDGLYIKCHTQIYSSEVEELKYITKCYKLSLAPLHDNVKPQKAQSVLSFYPMSLDRLPDKDKRIGWVYDTKTHTIKAYYRSNTELYDSNSTDYSYADMYDKNDHQLYGLFDSQLKINYYAPGQHDDDTYVYTGQKLFSDVISADAIGEGKRYQNLESVYEDDNFNTAGDNTKYGLVTYFNLDQPVQLYTVLPDGTHYFNGNEADNTSDSTLISKTGLSKKPAVAITGYYHNSGELVNIRCYSTGSGDSIIYYYWSTNWVDDSKPWKDQHEYELNNIISPQETIVNLYRCNNLIDENINLYSVANFTPVAKFPSDSDVKCYHISYTDHNGDSHSEFIQSASGTNIPQVDTIFNDLKDKYFVINSSTKYNTSNSDSFVSLYNLYINGITTYMCQPILVDDADNSLLDEDGNPLVWYDPVYNKYWNGINNYNQWVASKPAFNSVQMYDAESNLLTNVLDNYDSKTVTIDGIIYTYDEFYGISTAMYTVVGEPVEQPISTSEQLVVRLKLSNMVTADDIVHTYTFLDIDNEEVTFNGPVLATISSDGDEAFIFISVPAATNTVDDFKRIMYINIDDK